MNTPGGVQNLVDSRFVAQEFDKDHKNVLRDIGNLDCSAEFNRLNFELVKYQDVKGEKRPAYVMTRDGFMFSGVHQGIKIAVSRS